MVEISLDSEVGNFIIYRSFGLLAYRLNRGEIATEVRVIYNKTGEVLRDNVETPFFTFAFMARLINPKTL